MDALPEHVLKILKNIFHEVQGFIVKRGCPKGCNYFRRIIRAKTEKNRNTEEEYSALLSLQNEHSLPDKNRFKVAQLLAGSSREFEETLVLEDLSRSGFVVYPRLRDFDLQHLHLIVSTLARFHSLSFALQKEKPELYQTMATHIAKRTEYYEGLDVALRNRRNYFFSLIEDHKNRAKLAAYLEDPMGKLKYFYEPARGEPYNIISHGDCWANNFLFAYECDRPIDMRFLDWQLVRVSSPLCDLIYSIYMCSDHKIRREHLNRLFNLYYDTCTQNLSLMGHDVADCFPRPQFDWQTKLMLPFGMIISIMCIPVYLSDEDKIPDFNKVMTEPKDEDSKFVFEYSQRCKERLLGIAEEFALIDIHRE